MEALISVVIITYNQELYIRQSIESVWKQKVNVPIEILVGNDASTDHTKEILEHMKQDPQMHMRMIHREKNIGASANLYDLLKRARGKYIAFLEGDDYWTDCNKLQRQIDFLKKHTKYVGCTHECMLVDENGVRMPGQSLEWISKKREFDIRTHCGFYLAGQMGTLMCRNIFQGSGEKYDIIYKAHPIISDRTVQLALVLNGPLYRMNICMGAYRQFDGQKGENATSRYFTRNDHSHYDNFVLTCDLEAFAQTYMAKTIQFTYMKKIFFTNAVCQACRRHSYETCRDVRKILHYPGVRQWSYLLFLPRGILRKIIQKLKRWRLVWRFG